MSQMSVHTTQKQNVSKYDRILFVFFVCVILNNTNLSERQLWDIWKKFGYRNFNLLSK